MCVCVLLVGVVVVSDVPNLTSSGRGGGKLEDSVLRFDGFEIFVGYETLRLSLYASLAL